MSQQEFLRIGVFVDGGYLSHVSNFYRFGHERAARISITGLKDFIRHQVAIHESTERQLCQIVDAHYYRGRLSATESDLRNQLFFDRQFDDILAFAGFQTHYQPISGGKEKGVDVLLALDCFEQCTARKLDICVLVSGDSDFVPLIRKLHSYGTRVMVLGWNTIMVDEFGQDQETRCSFHLLSEASYPIHVQDLVDQAPPGTETTIDDLFFTPNVKEKERQGGEETRQPPPPPPTPPSVAKEPAKAIPRSSGLVCHLQDNFGFILCSTDNQRFFFHANDLMDVSYFSLNVDDNVTFEPSQNDRGPYARSVKTS